VLVVGVIGTYLSQFLKPKVKIHYWLPNSFLYTIPNAQLNPAPNPAPALPPPPGVAPPAPANFYLLVQSMTIQNLGRERADWVEIVHQQSPDFFQLHPALTFTESTAPNGQHTIRVESLAPREFFTIQFLYYTHAPQLMHVRSNAGHASLMPWMVVKKFPKWVYALMWLAMVIGIGFCAFWLIKGGIFIFKGA
jgi:hypothetical protein